MDSATAGLVGASIGAGIGFLGGLLNNIFQINLEKQRWIQSQQDNTKKALREQIAQAACQMLAAQHSMEWLTWRASLAPNSVSREMVTAYEQEIHRAFPALLGALAVIASLDDTVYRDLAAIAEGLYTLDTRIAEALLGFEKSPEAAITQVGECYSQATTLYRTVPLQIADVLKYASS